SSTQQYTVSNVPEFASVSSSTGMISSKGSEAIMVTIPNRKQIKEKKSGQLTVNVGNNAFVVSLSVEPYQEEPVNVDIAPQTLNFDANTEQQTFTMTSKNNRELNYAITSDLNILTVTPTNGTLKEKGKATITVNVQDRQAIDVDRVGRLTINIEGNTYVVTANIKKNGQDTPDDEQNVVRGLVAYYNFNKGNADDAIGSYHGFENGGTYITDTPNGSGKALYLKQKQSISVGSAPLDGKTNYSVSMWVKDFGAGYLLMTKRGNYYTAPSLMVTEDVKLRFYTGESDTYGTAKTYSADMSNYQNGKWVMLTIVCEPSGGQTMSTLYINGRKVDSGTSSNQLASGGTAMVIGGYSPMIIDNIRLYSVTLKDDEVAEIYASETEK
ncbi:MAG: hypothetical protein K2K03_08460, partial [Prevotella sp.]|nr:hypothetical protein [Prevotella sp.]